MFVGLYFNFLFSLTVTLWQAYVAHRDAGQ